MVGGNGSVVSSDDNDDSNSPITAGPSEIDSDSEDSSSKLDKWFDPRWISSKIASKLESTNFNKSDFSRLRFAKSIYAGLDGSQTVSVENQSKTDFRSFSVSSQGDKKDSVRSKSSVDPARNDSFFARDFTSIRNIFE